MGPKRRTIPVMNKCDAYNILTARCDQLDNYRDLPDPDVPKHLNHITDIVMWELVNSKLEGTVIRHFPNGDWENWRLDELPMNFVMKAATAHFRCMK